MSDFLNYVKNAPPFIGQWNFLSFSKKHVVWWRGWGVKGTKEKHPRPH